MQSTPTTRYLILAGLFAAALGAALLWGRPRGIAGPAVRLDLPERVGEWRAEEILFCQDPQCRKVFNADRVEDPPGTCPACGGELDHVSLAEKQTLPSDTVVRRTRYRRGHGEPITVTIVVSGTQRSSLHRPQWCLPGHGVSIVGTRVVEIPMPGREKPLRAMRLDLRPGNTPINPGGRRPVFLYWFVGPAGRETPRHLQRLLWMAWYDLVRSRYRWAYVAVSTDVLGVENRDMRELREFLAAFYPLIRKREVNGQ